MKTGLWVLAVLVVGAVTLVAQTQLPADAAAVFQGEKFRKHIAFLASDEMRGRTTPSPELERAAEYIAGEYQRIGLEPIGGVYKLPYTLVRPDLDTVSSATFLSITRDGVTSSFRLGKDFIPFDAAGAAPLRELPVACAGFGITAPEYGYDDYASVNVKGHVVVVLRGEPESPDTSRFRGPAITQYSSVSEKIRNARRHGAAGILLVDALRSPRKPLVTGYPWPSLFPKAGRSGGLFLPDSTPSIIALHIGENVVNALIGSLDSLRSIVKSIDETLQSPTKVLKNVAISASATIIRKPIVVHNVAGMLKGSKYPDEYVVMGAHYDHVGVGSPNAEGDSIYNGADDNASGTSSLLVAAEALAKSSVRPERSIVFLAFSAEEKGLLGSKSYVANSPLPLEKCVAMINTDMIGRCEAGKVSIGGHKRCPDLVRINEEENSKLAKPFSLAYDIEQYFFRSDQASFAMKRIPVLFYFTGEHADYHKPSDEIKLINFADLANISRLATSVLWRAAHLPRTTYIPAGFED